MIFLRKRLAGLFTFSLFGTLALGAEPDKEKPKVPPQATEALASFQLKRGFRMEVVAAEPMVVAPVAIAFDENGRLFVAEMRDYPGGRDQSPHLGRVRLLEDTDGDGTFDTDTVYAEDLAWPSALACSSGGVFVAVTPEIIFLKDSGGGAADARKVALSGFGAEAVAPKLDALLNSFTWGMDNRIHVGTAGIGGGINAPRAAGAAPGDLGRQDFSFDPISSTIAPESGPAVSGLAFDSRGRRWLCDFTCPIRQPICETRYLGRNPYFPPPKSVVNVPGAAGPIYRIMSSQAANKPASANPPIAPTKARGGCVYRGGLFPANYAENVFYADSAAGVIHRAILRDQGVEWIAERASDEPFSEFLVSSDPSFQPVQLVTGPEGALYIVDLHGGGSGGRIYRILPEKARTAKLPQLGKAKTYDLVAALAHTNGWVRDTAQRLLYERHELTAIALLTNMVNGSRFSYARLHALHTLDGLGALNQTVLLRGLRDPDESVREHAVLLCEKMVRDGNIADALWVQLKSLAGDPATRVRYQLAFTVGEIRRPDKLPVLAELLRRDLASGWFQAAVLSSLQEGAGQMCILMAGDARTRNGPAGLAFLQTLLTMIGLSRQGEVSQVIDWVLGANLAPQQTFTLLQALGEGLRRAGSSFSEADPRNRLQPVFEQTVAATLNDSLAEPIRLAALRLRSVSPYAAAAPGDFLQVLFGTGQSESVQAEGLATLARYQNPNIPGSVLGRWQVLSPTLRRNAVAGLLSRGDGVAPLLTALENGVVRDADLNSVQQDFLRTYRDPGLAQRAVRLFGPGAKERPTVFERFRGALTLAGNAASGRQTFQARCAACHRMDSLQPGFGPEIAEMRSGGRERILRGILEPNLETRPESLTYVVQTKAGENILALMTDQNQRTLTLCQQPGASVWLRENIEAIQPQPWSLMPQGTEEGLSVQAMADLLEFIMVSR